MSIMRDKNLEALTRQFEEDRARVWTDPSIPHDQKQAQVYRLWQEFDSQRRALQEGYFQGGTGAEPVSGITGRPVLFPRRRRRPWK
jgi:hypothetical protein